MRHLVVGAVLALVSPATSWGSPATLDVPAPAPARLPRLELGSKRALVLAGAAAALWGAALTEQAVDDVARCRWCDPGRFDRWTRRELRWGDPGIADDASDVTLLAASLGPAAAVGWLAARQADRREVVEDVFLVAAAFAMTDALTRGVQQATGRLRPQPWATGATRDDRDLRSFFSGHASRAFAAAAAAAQVSRLRGRRGWGWVAAAGFTAAAATAWFRVASDEHWATDVLAGAAVGTAIGWAIPTVSLRPVALGTVAVVPAPGGLAIVF